MHEFNVRRPVEHFLKDRQGAIVGARLAERFHWKIGDRIPLKSTLPHRKLGVQSRRHLPWKRPQDDETNSGFNMIFSRKKCLTA